MQATTTSPPCLQAPCIGETHFIRRKQTEFHMLVFPIQSHLRALAVKKNTGIGRCHRSAAGYRRRHTHPERTGQPAKLIAAAKCYGQRAPLPPVAALVVTHTSPGASCRTTVHTHATCGEMLGIYTSVMWRNMKLLHMWRNVRFIHICPVKKFGITPHVEKFQISLLGIGSP